MDDKHILELGVSFTERAIALLHSHAIYPDVLQTKMLETHIKAMVWRSYSGESLPELDMEMFDEISPICLTLAEQVCCWIENLAYEEAHLLSVHFEVAKENELNPTAGDTRCQ
ncbi:transcriptional regulator [Salinivibrio kushneri]|nr:transcriptional regulator [Salinivibrio kushneri]OOE46786.1 transcriptional regulator [Salinivibrio kushneri]OOE48316.1 transcriptional regulator [Salinivibrio kushneri]OOE49416.1 transcriptional regulator [Salinivibrio kushneri]OOE61707.1 transcriptional regulator [Salinivibrio kushneri]